MYAAHGGEVVQSGIDGHGGIGVTLFNKEHRIKTIYYHLKCALVEVGVKVSAGEIIGRADNTGKYTTGDHLHFGLKETNEFGGTINTSNGYWGAIDPAPLFEKNWDKSRAYHRYGRKRNWQAEFQMRFKNPWLHRQLKNRNLNPILSGEAINALVYGGWGLEDVINPAMAYNWMYLKKAEMLEGQKPFH